MANIVDYLIAVSFPSHFVLIPNKSIIIVQGQSGSIACESKGAGVALKWEKKIAGNTYASVDSSLVKDESDSSTATVRLTLKITNAKLSDGGDYKCTVTLRQLSDFKLTKIDVKGGLNCGLSNQQNKPSF